MFDVVRHCQTVSQSDCAILNSYQQNPRALRLPVVPYFLGTWHFNYYNRYVVASHYGFVDNLQDPDEW